jgi:hypothetical protein
MESYILKVYRRCSEDGTLVAGLLQDALSGDQQNFCCFEELQDLLSNKPNQSGTNKSKRRNSSLK